MVGFRCVALAGVILTMLGLDLARADDDATQLYPVRFLPTLPVRSVEEVEAQLSAPFDSRYEFLRTEERSDAAFDEPLRDTDTVGQEDGYRRVRYRQVANCLEVFAAREAGFGFGTARIAYDPNESTYINCQQLLFLKNARPSFLSYLQDFVLDENTPRVLPAVVAESKLLPYPDPNGEPPMTWMAGWNVENCEWLEGPSGERLMTPCPPEQPFEIRAESPYQVSYLLPYFGAPGQIEDLAAFEPYYEVTTLRLLAFADFNGDGTEDVLLGVDTGIEYATQGVYAERTRGMGPDYSFSVWLLTRFRAKEPLTVIERLSVCCNGDAW